MSKINAAKSARMQWNPSGWLAAMVCCALAVMALPADSHAAAAASLIRAKRYIVSEHGVVADGQTDNAAAIQKVIDICAQKGGGTVVIDKGTVVSGMIQLKDNVTLEIAEGATLKCTGDDRSAEAYPIVPLDFPSHAPERRALIFAQNCQNIGIVGAGTIDGNSGEYTPGKSARVGLVRFNGCTDITIKDVAFRNSSFWTQHYCRCDRIEVSNITVDNKMINDDGLNFDGCHDVKVWNCDISSRDDCITLKNLTHRASKDVLVEDCRLRTHKSAFKFGTESYDGFINVTARNLDIGGGRDALAFLSVDGARIENIRIEDVVVTDTECPLFIKLGSRLRAFGDETKDDLEVGSVDGITVANLKATGAQRAITIDGDHKKRIRNVHLKDIQVYFKPARKRVPVAERDVPDARKDNSYPKSTMFGPLNAWGLFIRQADDITLENVQLSHPDGSRAYMAYLKEVQGLKLIDFQAPAFDTEFAWMKVEDVNSLRLDMNWPQNNIPWMEVSGEKSGDITIVTAVKAVVAGEKVLFEGKKNPVKIEHKN